MSFDIPKSDNLIITTTPTTTVAQTAMPSTTISASTTASTTKTNSVFTATTKPTTETAVTTQTVSQKEPDIKVIEKNKIIENLKKKNKDNKVTEGDIYNELKRLEQEHQLTKEQKELLKYYEELKNIDKTNPGYSDKLFAQIAPDSLISAGLNTRTTSESSTLASEEPKTEKSPEEKDLENYIAKHKDIFENKTIDDVYSYLLRKPDKTEEEQKILNILKSNKKEASQDTKPADEQSSAISPENAEKLKKCNEIIQGSGTDYEKLSQIMDLYLSENDPEYQKLPDYQGKTYKYDRKRQYRDKLIKKLREDFAPGDLSTTERSIMHQKLTALFTNCIAQNKTIDSITSQGKGALKQEIEAISNREFSSIIQNVETKGTDQDVIISFADKLLANKPEYTNLTTKEEKIKYIRSKAGEIFEKTLGIPVENLKIDSETMPLIEKAAAEAIKEIVSKKYTESDLENPETQNKIINNVMTANPDLLEQIKEKLPKVFNGLMVYLEKNKLIAELKLNDKDGVITEGEIYKELKNREKNGSLTSPEQKEMLKYYERVIMMDKEIPNYSKTLFKQKASNSSLIARAALTGKDVPTYIHEMFAGKTEQEINKALKRLVPDVNSFPPNSEAFIAIFTELKEVYGPQEAYNKMKKMGMKQPRDFQIDAFIRNDGKSTAELGNIAANYGTKAEKEECLKVASASAKFLDNEQQSIYWENSNKYYDKTIAESVNNYKTKEDAVQIHAYVASSQIVSDERKSSVTKFMVETAAPDRQIYYAREMSKIKDAAVTEGLAAAEQNVDSSVRQQYSQYVDNAIKNNGYTSEQKANIEQARQTGQISYERSSSSEGASDKSSSTGTRTSSNTPSASRTSTGYATTVSSSTGGSGSSSGTASTSGSKPTYVAFGSTNYGDQVTKALSDKKERVQERITQIIDNYQKTTKAQEAKSEKQADTTSKEATSQAAKAAEKEAKVVKTFIESPQASGNIDAKTIQELKTAYSSGGMKGLYEKLGTLGETVQEKFLSFFAKYSDGNSLHSFASSFSNNKSVILSLYQYSNDPSLLAYLGESATMDLLSKGKIKLKDFLKYASPSTIALYISDLNKTGNHELLKQIFGLLNLSQASYVQQHTSKPTLGGDDWMEQLQGNMSRASGFEMADGLAMGSDRAPMGRSYDKMKQRGPFYFNA